MPLFYFFSKKSAVGQTVRELSTREFPFWVFNPKHFLFLCNLWFYIIKMPASEKLLITISQVDWVQPISDALWLEIVYAEQKQRCQLINNIPSCLPSIANNCETLEFARTSAGHKLNIHIKVIKKSDNGTEESLYDGFVSYNGVTYICEVYLPIKDTNKQNICFLNLDIR